MKYLYKHELIKYADGLPVKMYVCNVEANPLHWHKEIEILYLVHGELNINIENTYYRCKKNDIILINSNTVHSFTKTDEENVVIVIQIDLEVFKEYYPDIIKMVFACNSILNNADNSKYQTLRGHIIDILKAQNKKEKAFIIEINVIINQIILCLIRNFEYQIVDDEKIEKSNENLIRLGRILKYIDENFMNKISLSDIASQEYLSTYYFSHFFKDKMGMSFKTYLNNIRMQKAYNMLINTNEKVLDIVMKNGFANLQSFSSCFKEEYKLTPSQLRRKAMKGDIKLNECNTNSENKYREQDVKSVLEYIDIS